MFCPNCGKSTSVEQKFCRSCGLGLEKAAQSLAEQLSVNNIDTTLQNKQRKVERWLTLVGGSVISLFIISVLGGFIYKTILVEGEVLEGLGFLVFILGIITFALLALYRESLRKKSGKHLSSQTLPLQQPESAEKLLPASYAVALPGVTEHTTELLEVEKKNDAK
jgi:hypothetical protein